MEFHQKACSGKRWSSGVGNSQVKGRMEDLRALIRNKVSTPMQVTNWLRNEHLVAYSLDFSFKSRQLERGWASLSLSLLCWLHSTRWRAFRVLDFGGESGLFVSVQKGQQLFGAGCLTDRHSRGAQLSKATGQDWHMQAIGRRMENNRLLWKLS